MTFVPWTDYNICRKYALPHGKCKDKQCPLRHPPDEELRRLWNAHDDRTISQQQSSGPGQHEKPLPQPLREGIFSTEYGREHRSSSVSMTSPLQPAWTEQYLHTGSGLENTYSMPISSATVGMLPKRPEALPTQAQSSSQLSVSAASRDVDSYRPQQHIQPPAASEPFRHFEPTLSSNVFINGARTYRFAWGNPLCVRCGSLGHLPAKCRGLALSTSEQDYLYKLMKREQSRSKKEDPKPDFAQMRSGPSSREASSEPQVLWQRSASIPDDRRAVDAAAAAETGRPSFWQRYREQKEQSVLVSDGAGKDALPPTGHKRDFSDFMDGSRDGGPSLASNKTDFDRGESTSKSKKKRPKMEMGVGPAMAPVVGVSDFIHPSRVALVGNNTASPPASTRPSSLEAAVPPGTPPTTAAMGATKRMLNGEPKIIGPHPSTLRVSASYITQAAIEKRLSSDGLDAQERSLAEAREDTVRLQGVAWLDNVRRALQLPVKTFTTAVVYYHKFRLAHPKEDYQWVDAAAASLLTSCKNEDTLKKSRDILAAAYNMKQVNTHEQVAADDPMFEAQSRMVIGIERLILESGGFDFRSRAPHHTLVKIGKSLPRTADLKDVSQLAWTVLTDLHRTFAPLKQTSSTLALASLELAAHFTAAKSADNTCMVRDNLQRLDLRKWYTTREEVMETLLDALDLYTHTTASSILGTKYSLDDLLRIRLALNKECSESSLPRYTMIQPPPSPDNTNGTSSTLRVANGHPTPVSPPQAGAAPPAPVNAYTATAQHTPQTEGTLRFMLNPQRATEERAQVNSHYTEEWEEYEEENEVPLPGDRSPAGDSYRDKNGSLRRDHDRDRDRDRDVYGRRGMDDRNAFDRRGVRDSPRAAPQPKEPRAVRPPQPSNMLQSVVRAPSPAPEILVEKEEDRKRRTDSERARERDRSRDRDRRHEDRRGDGRYVSGRDRDDRDRRSGGGSERYYEDDRRRERR